MGPAETSSEAALTTNSTDKNTAKIFFISKRSFLKIFYKKIIPFDMEKVNMQSYVLCILEGKGFHVIEHVDASLVPSAEKCGI